SGSTTSPEYALKVMRQRFVDAELVRICTLLEPLQLWDGLRVCKRICLSPAAAPDALRSYPDLSYSILMPWISGLPWLQVVVKQMSLSQQYALALASELVLLLARLEGASMSHCDLSSANLIIDALDQKPQLIDVEDLFGTGFLPPRAIP